MPKLISTTCDDIAAGGSLPAGGLSHQVSGKRSDQLGEIVFGEAIYIVVQETVTDSFVLAKDPFEFEAEVSYHGVASGVPGSSLYEYPVEAKVLEEVAQQEG